MKASSCFAVVLIVFSFLACSLAQTQPASAQNQDIPTKTAIPPNPEITYARVMNAPVNILERVLMTLAMAMPEDKYGFAPTNGEFKGVRTFGEQLKHVAASNYSYASAILGEKPPVDLGEEEAGPANLKTKKDILKFLGDSFAYVHKAAKTIDDKNAISAIKSPFGQGPTTRVAMITLIVGHGYDHYGQLVEYVRMNGIIPPASQTQ